MNETKFKAGDMVVIPNGRVVRVTEVQTHGAFNEKQSVLYSGCFSDRLSPPEATDCRLATDEEAYRFHSINS